MSFISVIAAFLSAISFRVACGGTSKADPRLWGACAVVHLAFTIAYWQVSLADRADTWLYYSDFLGWADRKFEPGTIAVIKLVQHLKGSFGGTYLEYFLLFQSCGLIGISLLIRIFDEVARDLRLPLRKVCVVVLFLPGLHFWTSAIGKDAPLFLGIVVSIWAAMRIQTRFPAFILALMIITPVRPHISAIAGIALLGTLLFEARVKLVYKVLLALLMLPAMFIVLQATQQSLDITGLNPNSVAEFLASNRELGLRQGPGPLELPFILRVLTLLFRPLFFDVNGPLWWIASLENLILLLIFLVIVRRIPTVLRLASTSAYVRYCLIFSIVLIALLASVSFNIGIGLRQKWMAMPAILLLFVTLTMYRKARTELVVQRQTSPARHDHLEGTGGAVV